MKQETPATKQLPHYTVVSHLWNKKRKQKKKNKFKNKAIDNIIYLLVTFAIDIL